MTGLSSLIASQRAFLPALLWGGGLMALGSLLTLAVPWLGGMIADDLLTDSEQNLSVIAVGLITLLAVQTAITVSQRLVLDRTSERLTASLRNRLYDAVQRLELPDLETRTRGELVALVTREADILSLFVSHTLTSVVPRILLLLGSIVLMIRIDPLMALPVAVGVPIFYVTLRLYGRRMRGLASEMRETYGRSVSVAEQNLSVMPAIKSFGQEDKERDRHSIQVNRYLSLSLQMTGLDSVLGPVMQLMAAISVIVVLWFFGDAVRSGDLSAGQLVAFLMYAALLTRPVSGLIESWGQYQHAKGALNHMTDVLTAPSENLEKGDDLESVRGEITFEDVVYSYPDRPSVLQGASLVIHAGETVAITGANGSGKSTLVDLLQRFRKLDAGRILLDGQDIATLNLRSLRHAIAVVPQQMALVDGTLADNIRFGAPEASTDQIIAALRNADGHSLLESLPDGLHTRIGERGVRLSGGQRQRVALARALLRDPAVLVLDEATAMFDPEGEARFVELARNALFGRTVILITHRPASLILAKRVIRLNGGQFLEEQDAARAART